MDNSNKYNQRKENSGKDNVSVDVEIQKLFKRSNGKINQQDFVNLRNKYGNEELIEKIQRGFVEKYTMITKKAKKFAQLIRDKYANSSYPFHVLLEKAKKYKDKYRLSDEEFSEFQRIYENELVGLKSPDILQPNTNLQKLLGSVNVDYQGFTNALSDSDYKVLQDVLKLNATSKGLHSQVFLQSMQYQDCGLEALTGKYNRDIHSIANNVHPVIAALFLPRIDVLEQHFIHSNISNIVKTRYNKEQFTSMADVLLYDALIKDPNDVVCDTRSVMVDLYNRAQLQNQLWNNVLSLRNGQYYNASFAEFITAVDTCKMNKYDSPDLVYGRFDGTILKRLLSAFSFRPTVITVTPSFQMFNANPYQQNIKPMVTNVHMINLKLPYSNDNEPVDLNDALQQTQLIVENGMVVPKNTSLIYSRGVLFFYVDRRTNIITNNQLSSFAFTKLPSAVAGFERLNDRRINFEYSFRIRQDEYKLRSVVLSETNQFAQEKNIVIGSKTAVIVPADYDAGRYTDEYILYDPYCAGSITVVNSVVQTFQPIQPIPNLGANDVLGFNQLASTTGIIFMYELVKDTTSGTIIY